MVDREKVEAGTAADAASAEAGIGAKVEAEAEAAAVAETEAETDDLALAVDREVLIGGVNEVVREGGTVRRPTGPWSETVQRLLAHLAAGGFDGAPAPLGLSEDGSEERVAYLPGEIGHDFAAPDVRSDASLVAAAKLLRRLHDASATFVRTAADVWYMPVREPAEVICHGDAATYNTVFRDGVPVAFIDFDTAHPAPRIWDAAYTAYRFVPLYAPDESELTQPVDEARRRLALFADAYGLTDAERAALPGTAAERLRAHVELMRSQAAAGNVAFARHIAEGHDRRYSTDAEWTERVYGGVLRTDRLALRPVRPDVDEAWLLDHWTDLDVRRFLHDGETLTPEQIAEEIAESVHSFAEDGYGLWIVELTEDDADADTDLDAELSEVGGSDQFAELAECSKPAEPGPDQGGADRDAAADTPPADRVYRTDCADYGSGVDRAARADCAAPTTRAAHAARTGRTGDGSSGSDLSRATTTHRASVVRHAADAACLDCGWQQAGTSRRLRRIGTVGIRPLDDLGPELYYSLAPDAWGRGYATEAARVVLDHALGPLGVPELLAEVDADNGASAAIIAKLGMVSFDVVPGVLGPMTRYRTVSSLSTPQ